jgi:hypothetical protein
MPGGVNLCVISIIYAWYNITLIRWRSYVVLKCSLVYILLICTVLLNYFTGAELSCYDSLRISGSLSKEFCATITPAPFVPGLNVVTLRMVTDTSVEQSGFDLKFTTIRSKQYFRSVCSGALEINRAAIDWS